MGSSKGEEKMSKKYDAKILEDVEACIVKGKDSDDCLKEAISKHNLSESDREPLKKAVLEFTKHK